MFNDSESFYYCPDGDITNCIQRQQSLDPMTPFWQRADDRFFWNKYMLQDLINSKSYLCHPWLIPIIQGYVQIESCKISFDDEFDTNSSHENSQTELYNLNFKLFLISRRSRHRAGTWYKRRGVDEEGNTANYRYYISRVKDVHRQAIVDLMLGNPIEEFERVDAAEEPEVLVEKEENLKTLVDECKKMLIQEPDECLGGWGLIRCDDLVGDIDPTQQDMDIILLLSQKA